MRRVVGRAQESRTAAVWGALSLAGVLLGANPAGAQAPPPPPELPRVLREAREFDPSLARTTLLGVYLREKRVGLLKSTISRAPAESGAMYLEETTLDLELAWGAYHQEVRLLLALDLSLVRKETQEEARRPEPSGVVRTWLEVKAGQWVRSQAHDTKEGSLTAERTPALGPNYGPCLTALASKFAGQAGVYRVPAILWAGSDRRETGPATLSFAVGEPGEVQHRGRAVQAVLVKVTGKGEPLELTLTPSGELLVMEGSGLPYRFVAGSAEETARDLSVAAPAAPGGAASPKEAVAVFLHASARARPVADLDQVIDFEAVLARLKLESPEQTAKLSAQDVSLLFKTRIESEQAPLTKALADKALSKLRVKIEEDAASAQLPGYKEAFLLRRTAGGRWLIVAWPAR